MTEETKVMSFGSLNMSTYPETSRYGIKIKALIGGIYKLVCQKDPSSNNPTTAYLYLKTGTATGDLLDTQVFSSNLVTFNVNLIENSEYYLVADAGGANYTLGYGNFSIASNEHLYMSAAVNIGFWEDTSQIYVFNSITTTRLFPVGYVGTGTSRTKYINTNYPFEYGLEAGTTKLKPQKNLIAENSLIVDSDRVGL